MRYTVQQYLSTILLISLISTTFLSWVSPVYSVTVNDLESEINQKQEELNKSKSTLSAIEQRIKEISGSSYSLTEKINLLNAEITKLQTSIDTKAKEIEDKQKLLETKKEYFDMVSTQLYMETRQNSAQIFFSFSNLDNLLQNLFVKKNAIAILREDIEKIHGEFTSLSQIKEDLDKQKKDLDDSYALVQAEKQKLQKELNAQLAAKKNVTRTINGLSATLSDLQYQLLISRQGGTYVNPDSIPTSGGITSLRGFLDQAPSGSFGVFLFGAYTHRNGMSQWGAKARAEAPYFQNYQQILNAYYPSSVLATGTIENITVKFCDQWKTGKTCSECAVPIRTATYNFEYDYLYRLGEMPEYFPKEALKAQAVSARTYALNATNYGVNSIWGDQCGQVIAGQKTDTWKTAVDDTRGVVMYRNGRVFSSQYAAVHGGWGNDVKWDTTDGTGNGDWMSRSYESISKVSWFYRTWYGDTNQEGNGTCSRSPWLSQTEMADLVNVYQLWKSSGGNDPRIYPVIDACHVNKGQYSYNEARSLAAKPVSSISSVAVANSNGNTNSVVFVTNAGVISMTGNEFKTIYNLRAPGHLHIPQTSFVHINIHKK